MRVLVTGAAGYIGSITARLLAECGHDVTAMDSMERGHRAAVGRLPLERLNLLDRSAVADCLRRRRIEAVLHFGAYALVGESVAQPDRYFRNNAGGTLALASAMAEADVGLVVLSSTAAVYGEPERQPLTEDVETRPSNPYGRSKRLAEEILSSYAHSGVLSAVALRYFNAAGAAVEWDLGEDHQPETHLIPRICRTALGIGSPFRLFGEDYPTPDGTCVRDYVHVLDLAEAHRLALERLAAGPRGSFEAINLGAGQGYSVRQVITTAGRVLDRPIPVSAAPRRPGDPPQLVASIERARRQLGWEPRRSVLEAIIEDTWRWHRAHPEGYGP